MRNQFRSSFRATARPHGQLRSLSNCCSCMCESVSVRGLTCEEPETERPPLSQKAYCHSTVLSVCVCVVTLNFGGSVLPLSPSPPLYAVLVWVEVPHQPGQPLKFTVTESCDRIKEEFHFLQAQYHRWEFQRWQTSAWKHLLIIRPWHIIPVKLDIILLIDLHVCYYYTDQNINRENNE